ncbi:MAG: PP2C family protein-serine/threonine phosphatase [Clostridia bacterium]|nr:PP2C family protein-serine/threonine phosphatase [Clostridia bacterium]
MNMKFIRKGVNSGQPVDKTDIQQTTQVFWENEVAANRLITRSMFVCAFTLLACWLLNAVGVLSIHGEYVLPVFLAGTVSLLIPAGICQACRGEKKWVKYVLLLSITVILAYLDSILTFNVPLLIIMPVVFSCRYYSSRITIRTAALASVLFALSSWIGAVINFNNPDLNFANPDMAVYVRDVMLLSFLPKWMIFAVLSAFCCVIAQCGRKMVLRQLEISRKATRVETELEMAANIQMQALPAADSLPENSCRAFDLATVMDPAKEVGGDFYDFFYPDDSHLAMIIADVADKGIAASLFMMMSKTMLDSRITSSCSPGEVLAQVNRQLEASSPDGMFVTVWLGILDLRTGELVTANAGHEYPVLCRKNGDFELVKDPHGFVLGGMPNVRYREYRMTLDEGDTLFVYTDGVPEAYNGTEQFGTERMLASLNRYKDRCMTELIAGVKGDIDAFVSGASQFDDMTMLAFRLLEPKNGNGMDAAV